MNTIEHICCSIETSLKHEAHYSALNAALTLPDVCGVVEFGLVARSRQRYIDWFRLFPGRKYVRSGYQNSVDFLLAENCYALRCSLLHMAQSDIGTQSARVGNLTKIHFHTDSFDTGHCNLNCDAIEGLQLNVGRFRQDMVDGCREWLASARVDPAKAAILDQLMVIRTC